ncbi:MAG: hypothetical protein ACTHJP_00755 [Rhodanobacteraceae bacterium]
MAAATARRDAGTVMQAIPSDLDEAQLAMLVDRFYDKVRVDPLLGPVFAPRVDD